MLRTAKIAQIALRGSGVLTLLIGLSFWVGYGSSLRQVHMLLGVIVVLALWTLAGIAAKVGAPLPRVVMAVLWGFVVVALGMTQMQFFPGSLHWVIRVTHLLVGIGAMAQGERLARFALRFGVAAAATGAGASAAPRGPA
jgi:asparagine N-glycosylation enzyme membrane subunit Stt3